jgi:hypothetical protein
MCSLRTSSRESGRQFLVVGEVGVAMLQVLGHVADVDEIASGTNQAKGFLGIAGGFISYVSVFRMSLPNRSASAELGEQACGAPGAR